MRLNRAYILLIGNSVYGQLFIYPREEITSQMNRYYAQMTKPYLQMFMQKLATSPEAFLTIRKEFTRSFAALNICSYLLGETTDIRSQGGLSTKDLEILISFAGIGDRHLENFLVDLKR